MICSNIRIFEMISSFFRNIHKILLGTLLLLFCSCGGSSKQRYEIALDPLWYPLELMGRENNVFGFSNDLLKAISKEKHIEFSLLSTNWDTLIEGLNQKKYQGVLSSLYPYNFNQQHYQFSETYLQTGPVLLLPSQSSYTSLSEMATKEVGVISGSPYVLIAEKNPGIIIRLYDTIPHMLNDLTAGHLDGAVIPLLEAEAFVQDLYHGQLKIATGPLNDEGLRLICLKNQDPALIQEFNEGLTQLKADGTYQRILEKWSLKGPSL